MTIGLDVQRSKLVHILLGVIKLFFIHIHLIYKHGSLKYRLLQRETKMSCFDSILKRTGINAAFA